MSESITGKNLIDFMTEGVGSFVKRHIANEIIEELVNDFRTRISEHVNKTISEMVFKSHSVMTSHSEMNPELRLIIEWVKSRPEFKAKYEIKESIIEE